MCNNPVYRTVRFGKIGEQKVLTPCGGCLGCRVDRLQMWQARCNSEYIKHRSAFLTFTYDNNHLEYNDNAVFPTLRRDHLHRYIDNLRHKVKSLPALPAGSTKDFSYFACGEYGDTFRRPHYHVLFFGLDFKDFEKFFISTWKNGNIKCLPILQGGIRYVVDYMTKQLTGSAAVKEYDNTFRERPFTSYSKGLGSDFFFAHKTEISETGAVKIGSRKVPVPVYYINLCSNFDFDSISNRDKKVLDNYRQTMIKARSQGFSTYDEYMNYCRRANELSLANRYRSKGVPVSPSYPKLLEFVENPLRVSG